MVHPDPWGSAALLETAVHPAPPVFPDHQDHRVSKVNVDQRVTLDLQVSRDHQVFKDRRESRASQGSQDGVENRADQADLDRLEKGAIPGNRELLVLSAIPEKSGSWDHLDGTVTEERRDLLAPGVMSDRLEL